MASHNTLLDTAPVTVTLLQLERLPAGRMGRVTHLAVCDAEWGGIGFQVHGLRVQRGPDGGARVLPSAWRHPTSGKWHAGLILPEVLQDAIAQTVLEAVQEAARAAPAPGGVRLPPPDPRASGARPGSPAAPVPMTGGG